MKWIHFVFCGFLFLFLKQSKDQRQKNKPLTCSSFGCMYTYGMQICEGKYSKSTNTDFQTFIC